MDFLADEMHGLRIRSHGGSHPVFRSDFHLTGRAATAIITTALERAALAAFTRSTGARSAVVAARRAVIATGKCFGFALGLVAGCACPRGSEGKAGQEAAQWIGFRITHEAQSKERIRK